MFGSRTRHGITHNISKIELKITCRFWTTANLGQSDFNFSCKNYQSKVGPCFVEVVELFPKKPTNFVLHLYHFSTIFYKFYKVQNLHPISRRNSFTNRPSDFTDRFSGRKFRLQLGPWCHGRQRELDSGEGKARLSRERAEEARVIT
jgi:hypothetical protein